MNKTLVVKIELPEDIAMLIENDEIIRDAIKSHITKEVIEKIILIAIADSILKDKGLTEEEVMKIDKIIKKDIRSRIENEIEHNES